MDQKKKKTHLAQVMSKNVNQGTKNQKSGYKKNVKKKKKLT